LRANEASGYSLSRLEPIEDDGSGHVVAETSVGADVSAKALEDLRLGLYEDIRVGDEVPIPDFQANANGLSFAPEFAAESFRTDTLRADLLETARAQAVCNEPEGLPIHLI